MARNRGRESEPRVTAGKANPSQVPREGDAKQEIHGQGYQREADRRSGVFACEVPRRQYLDVGKAEQAHGKRLQRQRRHFDVEIGERSAVEYRRHERFGEHDESDRSRQHDEHRQFHRPVERCSEFVDGIVRGLS